LPDGKTIELGSKILEAAQCIF